MYSMHCYSGIRGQSNAPSGAKVLCRVSVGSGGIQHSEVTDRRNLTIIELIVNNKNTFDKRSGQNVPIAKCKKSRKYIAKCS